MSARSLSLLYASKIFLLSALRPSLLCVYLSCAQDVSLAFFNPCAMRCFNSLENRRHRMPNWSIAPLPPLTGAVPRQRGTGATASHAVIFLRRDASTTQEGFLHLTRIENLQRCLIGRRWGKPTAVPLHSRGCLQKSGGVLLDKAQSLHSGSLLLPLPDPPIYVAQLPHLPQVPGKALAPQLALRAQPHLT